MDPRYSPQVLEHFRQPRHAGRLPRGQPDVGTGEARADGCEDRVRLQVRVDARGRLAQVRFQAFGCPATIACASFAAERLCEASRSAAEALSPQEIATALALSRAQRRLAELPVRALRAALDALEVGGILRLPTEKR